MEILANLLAGKKIALYLADTEEPMVGMFRGCADDFIVISDDANGPIVMVDRDSVWCITELPATVTQ